MQPTALQTDFNKRKGFSTTFIYYKVRGCANFGAAPSLSEKYAEGLPRANQKGNFCVTLDSKILMYDSTLRFSHLRKP